MSLQKFRSSKNNTQKETTESYLPLENIKKIGNPPAEDISRWEEDGGTIVYDCFVTDQSFQPHDGDIYLDESH